MALWVAGHCRIETKLCLKNYLSALQMKKTAMLPPISFVFRLFFKWECLDIPETIWGGAFENTWVWATGPSLRAPTVSLNVLDRVFFPQFWLLSVGIGRVGRPLIWGGRTFQKKSRWVWAWEKVVIKYFGG